MSTLSLAPEVWLDLERFIHHLVRSDIEVTPGRIEEIIIGLDVLTHSPLVGRPRADGKRELIIGHGSKGYVALYRYMVDLDTVVVLALRHQREAGYAR